jgi:hypothetical protein
LYGEITLGETYIPEDFQDPEIRARVEAINDGMNLPPQKALKEAERLEKADKIEDALKLYWLAPSRFAQKIWKYKKPVINDYLSQAQNFEKQNNIPKALEFYTKASVELEAIFDDKKEMMYDFPDDMPDFGLTEEEQEEAEGLREQVTLKVQKLSAGSNLGKAQQLADQNKLLQALNNLTAALNETVGALR